MPKAQDVCNMFSRIASKYDKANHILSFGIDFYWRNTLVKKVSTLSPKVVVDLATGSGDVAFALSRKLASCTKIIGVDFCQELLNLAEQKQKKRGTCVQFLNADCSALPFESHSIDVATLAFGLRNFEDRHLALKEIKRVLKPNGHLLILEFTKANWYIRPFYYIYLHFLLPILAYISTGNKAAYRYLGDSIKDFPNKENLCVEIKKAGFKHVYVQGLTASLVAIHECQ